MSNSNGAERQSKNERRDAAREKARLLREDKRKKDRRTRWIIQGSVIGSTLAIVAVVALVIMNSAQPSAPGPRNMLSDGILIGEGFEVVPTEGIQPGEQPVANVRDEESDVISIQMFVDYLCPICGVFEDTNGEQIATWVDSGAATVEIFPYAILDRASQGTKYPTRAANAAACVANYSPNQFFDFNTILFANQPEENTLGLSDEEIVALTVEANVEKAPTIGQCIRDQKFKTWVAEARERHGAGPVPNSNVDSVAGTPTIIVDGVQYTGALNDPAAFSAFVLQAANSSFNEKASSTATPTPTPAP
jgi:protein-disulfide isomerase